MPTALPEISFIETMSDQCTEYYCLVKTKNLIIEND